MKTVCVFYSVTFAVTNYETELLTTDDAGVYLSKPDLSTHLFGDNAFKGTSQILYLMVSWFVQTLTSIAWNCHHKVICERKKINTGLKDVKDKWIGTLITLIYGQTNSVKAMTAEGAKPTSLQIQAFFKKLHKLLFLMSQYDNKDSRTAINSYVANMEAMLVTMHKDTGTETSTSKL